MTVPENFSGPLHSLRGIAALVVVLAHAWIPVARFGSPTPLFLSLFNSGSAVSLFFVLSGLVLALSFERSPPDNLLGYAKYAIRRAFRLLPLLALTVVIGSACIAFFGARAAIPFQNIGPLDLSHFVAAFIGYSIRPNPPSWSIYVELTISFLLPMMWLAYKSPYRVPFFIAIVCLSAKDFGLQHCWNFYLVNFLAGISITSWGSALRFSSRSAFWPFFALLALFYFDRSLIVWLLGYDDAMMIDNQWINFVDVTLIAPIISVVFYNADRFSLLANKAYVFLGHISYSIYLNHWVVLWVASNFVVWLWPDAKMNPNVFWTVLTVLTMTITIPLSWASYRWIELPGMSIGKTLAARIAQPKAVKAT